MREDIDYHLERLTLIQGLRDDFNLMWTERAAVSDLTEALRRGSASIEEWRDWAGFNKSNNSFVKDSPLKIKQDELSAANLAFSSRVSSILDNPTMNEDEQTFAFRGYGKLKGVCNDLMNAVDILTKIIITGESLDSSNSVNQVIDGYFSKIQTKFDAAENYIKNLSEE